MTATGTEQDATQGTIVSTRRIAAPRSLVYETWTQLDHRRQWFKGPRQTEVARSLDLRVGGTELAHGRFDDTGIESIYTARFHLIEPEVRLIYAFDMHVDGAHFSVSLTRVDFEDAPGGTDLTYTEHAFFLSGDYGLEGRIEGTEILMDQITAYASTLADQSREDAR
jgi:uncharacterized protein YndB with AHSA1/START domain